MDASPKLPEYTNTMFAELVRWRWATTAANGISRICFVLTRSIWPSKRAGGGGWTLRNFFSGTCSSDYSELRLATAKLDNGHRMWKFAINHCAQISEHGAAGPKRGAENEKPPANLPAASGLDWSGSIHIAAALICRGIRAAGNKSNK